MKTKIVIKILLICSLITCVAIEAVHRIFPAGNTTVPAVLTRHRIEAYLAELPSGADWIKHLEDDLMPFWTTETALGGQERGNFPSYRDNRGKLIDWSKSREEQPPEIQGGLYLGLIVPDREYLRTRSRQIFGYCIAFQMTGDRKYLGHAYDGIKSNYLEKGRYYDETDGTLFAWFDPGTKTYHHGTSQDWAYGLSGPAYYYCVTKDERILPMLLKSREKLRETYFDPAFGMYRWVFRDTESDKRNQREIVSNLDQIYGYMLFLFRSLPGEERKIWKQELRDLAVILLEEFQVEQNGFFWGQIAQTAGKHLGSEHTDFGHSTKAYWLIMQIGRLTDDPALEQIGREGAARLVGRAWDPICETWNQKLIVDSSGTTLVPVRDRDWWSLAIMDQTAATLSLRNPDFLRYLSKTHLFWRENMVDPNHKEMWHLLKADRTEPDEGFPKQHAWKTCFHSTEHALVMYLTSQQLHGEPAVLHFIRNADDYRNPEAYYPYIFEGEVSSDGVTIETNSFELPESPIPRVQVRISFNSIR